MSLGLFKLFTKVYKQNLPRYPLKTAFQSKYVTAMDVVPKESSETDEVSNKKFTRFRKRQWENREKWDNGESEKKKPCDGDQPFERIKKKKMAMLLGYCGVDYYGMQRNPGVPTIEEELLKALFDAKYITEEDFKNQQSTQFQRSSRTDKGVSAARQVVSMKMPLEVNVEEINNRLPSCIKVFAIKRVTNKFNSKGNCNARTYSYTLPTYAFEPSLTTLDERKKYRVPAEKLELVNSVLGAYKGTKSYHNFTEKKYYTDPSASRFMMSFGVEKTFVSSDMEFAVLLVKGQSFMLHQIRKMVGLMLAVVRGHTDMAMIDRAFGKEKLIMPTAPGLGLVLDMVHYDRYDVRYKTSHDSLTWEDVEPTVQTFKHEFIYPNIVKGELEDDSAGLWLERLGRHTFEPSDEAPSDKTDDKAEVVGGGDDDDDDGDDDDEKGEVIDSSEIKESTAVEEEVKENVESSEVKNNVELKEVA